MSPTASNKDLDRQALGRFLTMLVLLFFVYSLVDLFGSTESREFINWTGPIALLVTCALTGIRLVKRNPLLIWTPLPWFLAACGTYFGFGPLLYTFGNTATVADSSIIWAVDILDLFRTNQLNVTGILIVTLSFYVSYDYFRQGGDRGTSRITDNRTVEIITVGFLALGTFVKFRYSLPYEFGLTDEVLPGSFYSLEQMTKLGLAMLGYLAVRKGGIWLVILGVLLALEASVELLRFSKAALLLAFLMPLLGSFLAKPRATVLVVGGLGIVCIYVLATPIVGWGRIDLTERAGGFHGVPLEERLDIIQQGSFTGTTNEQHDESQDWWSRLNYAPLQAFAMRQYDEGKSGASLGLALYALVPRILWPEKPDMTDMARDFTELALGYRGFNTSIGIFGEAYWNGGWWMVGAVCVYVGFLFSVLTRVSLLRMRRREIIFLPCILLGMQMGFRVDGWIVPDYIGAPVLYAAYFAIIYLIPVARGSRIAKDVREPNHPRKAGSDYM